MDLVRVDNDGCLFLSPDIDDWGTLEAAGITTIIDPDGGLDIGVPTVPNSILYLYFPFNDAELPNFSKLHEVARLGANLVRHGHKVLSHCGLGFNRSALVAGMILRYLGMPGPEALEVVRRQRPGALYNAEYAAYLASCDVQA